MKTGIRKPSIKKSISARTTGKLNRSIKKTVNPMYGRKGTGIIKDPKKALYNKVYNKTTIGIKDIGKTLSKLPYKKDNNMSYSNSKYEQKDILDLSKSETSLKYSYNDREDLIVRINKIKRLRILFNVIGYPILISNTFGVIVSIHAFTPLINLFMILIMLGPWAFMVYKARELKKEIPILTDELNSLEDDSFSSNVDKLLNNREHGNILYDSSNQNELLEEIMQNNLEVIKLLRTIAKGIGQYHFDSPEIYSNCIAIYLANMVNASNILLNQKDVDDLHIPLKKCIECDIISLKYGIQILINNSKILVLDYKATGKIDNRELIRDVYSLIEDCNSINENIKCLYQ